MKLAKDLEVVGRLPAINGRLGILSLDLLELFLAHLLMGQFLSKALTSRTLGVLDLVAPENLIRQVVGVLKGLAQYPLLNLCAMVLPDLEFRRDLHGEIHHGHIQIGDPQFQTEKHAHTIGPLKIDIVQIADTAPRFHVEFVKGKVLHVMITGEELVSPLSREHNRHVIRGQLTGEIAWDGAADQRRVIALQLLDHNGQGLVVFLLSKEQFVMCGADMLGCNAGRLYVVAHVPILILHPHHEGVKMGDLLGRYGRHQAAVNPTAAEGSHRDFRIRQQPFLHRVNECLPNQITGLVDIRENMVFNLWNLVVLHKAFLGRVIVTGRKFVDFVHSCEGHGPQL